MDIELILDFITNLLLLMSLAVVYSVFKNNSFLHPYLRKFLMGVMVSFIALIIMTNPIVIEEGIQFDTRAVLLSVSGMFLGFIPTLMGVIVSTAIRINTGGIGAFTGVLWIFVSAGLGLLWRYYRLKRNHLNKYKINWIEFYVFGLIIQLIMILLLITLPADKAIETINVVAFPLIVIYPIGSLFVSQFMFIQRGQYFSGLKVIISERQYKNLFNLSKANLVLSMASTGDIVDVNQTALDTYGYTFEEITKLNLTNINTLSPERVKVLIQKARDKNQSHLQFKHMKKSGEVIDVEVHTGPVKIDGIEYLYSTIIDITERIENQKLFKDADERLKATLLSVGEGIVVTDEHARITLINDKALELLGSSTTPWRRKVFEEFRIYSNQSDVKFEDIFTNCIENSVKFKSDNTFSLLSNDDNKTIFIDFTISPINFEEDINHGGILVLRDVTIEKERQEEIRFMSQHDYLTGLYNRYNFEQEMKRLNTERQLPISIIIGDVNGLKLLNDSFGHLEGDKLLKEVATIFSKATRSEDIVARWGGDEFTVLLPQTSYEDAHRVIERISDLCNKSMYDIIKPSIAIGVATKTRKEQSVIDILNAAEEKMYNHKLVEGKQMRAQLLENLLEMVNKKALDNKSHSENISELVTLYSEFHDLPTQQIEELHLLAKYHDIGRIAIPDKILNKPENLNDYEWSRIKAHPEIGSRIVSAVSDIQHITTDVLHHHEWFDGNGYPQHLSGNDITFNARLLSVLDTYESIVNDKVYRERRSHDEAITEILKGTGKQFDPEIVKLFIQIFEKDNQ